MQLLSILASSALLTSGVAAAAAHIPDIATDYSSGTVGVLSKFDDEMFQLSRIQAGAVSAARASDDGSFTTCLPVYGVSQAKCPVPSLTLRRQVARPAA